MKKIERLLWSIAFPGFGQLLNHDYIKGIVFILLELLINTHGHFNMTIAYSFRGEIDLAFAEANIGWLMFYPCVYFYSMWDAYKNANEPVSTYTSLPFVFSAFCVTVGVMLAPMIQFPAFRPGPVFFPMLCVIPGVGIGLILKFILSQSFNKEES
ncbi:hypothetical protein JOD43_000167 [Pullulanibacillus pueri]|uniref:Uncharacterized protein n=1 Tax=Pullulanibacillus pueri TaxID=1437324 RepID=A0A8J2ZSH0_9BACL|nr:hypothetical protein [Pullulanibacillus pueri]MBM7680008.1 hypothetical protein [Pullulanibacillus pueri]GGH73914.1 hypothetical protein GCM10007096_01620 [Pullulanibacillus pueri]